MEVDESTVTGNFEIIEAITNGLDPNFNDEGFPEFVKIIAGDQPSITR